MELCTAAFLAALCFASGASAHQVNSAEQTVVTGTNATGASLAAAILASAERGNLVFSPYSATMAHLMAAYGCKGDDRKELLKGLGMQDLVGDQAILQGAGIQQVLVRVKGNPFTSANAFATVGDTQAVDAFKAQVQSAFGGEFFALAQNGALDAVNTWAATKSRDRIPKLLDTLPMSQGILLLNAATFDGEWTVHFEHHHAFNGEPPNFTIADGTKIVAETMKRRAAQTRFASAESFDAVSLPYRDGEFTMLVMLPHVGSRPADALNELQTLDVAKFIAGMQSGMADVVLPKFTLRSKCDLTGPLRSIGINRIFDGFDARGMATMNQPLPDHVVVDLQRAYIEVDEAGTKAAAVTAIGIAPTAVIGGSNVKSFVVDRPFVYAIVHKDTGLMVFLGVCSTPPTANAQ